MNGFLASQSSEISILEPSYILVVGEYGIVIYLEHWEKGLAGVL